MRNINNESRNEITYAICADSSEHKNNQRIVGFVIEIDIRSNRDKREDTIAWGGQL